MGRLAVAGGRKLPASRASLLRAECGESQCFLPRHHPRARADGLFRLRLCPAISELDQRSRISAEATWASTRHAKVSRVWGQMSGPCFISRSTQCDATAMTPSTLDGITSQQTLGARVDFVPVLRGMGAARKRTSMGLDSRQDGIVVFHDPHPGASTSSAMIAIPVARAMATASSSIRDRW
jgi:hypothetical protein